MKGFKKATIIAAIAAIITAVVVTVVRPSFLEGSKLFAEAASDGYVFVNCMIRTFIFVMLCYAALALLGAIISQIIALFASKFKTARYREVKKFVVNNGECFYYVEALSPDEGVRISKIDIKEDCIEVESSFENWTEVKRVCCPEKSELEDPKEGQYVYAAKMGLIWMFFPGDTSLRYQILKLRSDIIESILFRLCVFMFVLLCFKIII